MRHSFVMRLRERGTNIEIVQKVLGHASTGIYTEPHFDDLQDAVEVL